MLETEAGPEIISESAEWIVLNKPAGWLTIPGRDPASQAQVVNEWGRKRFGRVWVVHRLDLETSGVLLLARTAEAHRKAGLWFQKHEVRKHYEFLAQGNPARPVFRVDLPIESSPSRTQLEVKERFPGAAVFLGVATPLSGRRHQIRIHLSHAGHPILGDPRYGGSRELATRVALHARRLTLPGGECFEASWPADFSGWVDQLRGVK